MKHPPTHPHPRGFTLLEALLLVVILGISGAAIGRALAAMTKTPEQNNNRLAAEAALLDKMESLRGTPWPQLAADANQPTSAFTDSITLPGSGDTVTRTVYIIYINPANLLPSGSPTKMLEVNVTVGSDTLSNMLNQP
ncbi:MAG: type IV pilus modification PilV family protein [Phycisphaerae bacterium]